MNEIEKEKMIVQSFKPYEWRFVFMSRILEEMREIQKEASGIDDVSRHHVRWREGR